MIRGYFATRGATQRPVVNAILSFPALALDLEVRLLVDTGADRTLLTHLDAERLIERSGIDFATLPRGDPSTGVGGRMATRTIDAVLTIAAFSTPLRLTVLEPPPAPQPLLAIPSLLGRDVISRFALIVDQRTQRVVLLEPEEADALNLP